MEEETWETFVNRLRDFVSKTLSLISTIELDGEKGVTEMGLKLIVLAFLSTRDGYEVESERAVEGGRMDIFVRDRHRGVLIIELKYVRIGFLALSKMPTSTPHTAKYAMYKNVDEKVARMEYKDLLLLINRRYTKTLDKNGKSTQQLSNERLSDIIDGANEQLGRYSKALLIGGIRPVEKNTKIYSVVLVGIGRRVISTEVIAHE
jgi:hypothetical protein